MINNKSNGNLQLRKHKIFHFQNNNIEKIALNHQMYLIKGLQLIYLGTKILKNKSIKVDIVLILK